MRRTGFWRLAGHMADRESIQVFSASFVDFDGHVTSHLGDAGPEAAILYLTKKLNRKNA